MGSIPKKKLGVHRPVNAGPQLVECIRACYAANLPPLLVGKHGVGKSEILRQAADELGIDFIVRDLSIMEPPDLVGMPKLDGDRTRYLPPAFLPTEGRGLLVFEELNRCPTYMRAPCLQLLTARTLNDYQLPKDWLPVAAINPPEQDYDVHDLDPALLSRFVRIEVIADRRSWLTWAEAAGGHPDVMAYIKVEEHIFDDPWSSPRAWKYVSDLLLANPDSKRLGFLIAGIVGKTRAVAFSEFRRNDFEAAPEVDVLLAAYSQYANLVQTWTNDDRRIDLCHQIVHAIKLLVQTQERLDSLQKDKNKRANLRLLIGDLPADLAEDLREFIASYDPRNKLQLKKGKP